MLYLNVGPGRAVHRLSLSHDNAAVALLLGESGGFGGLRALCRLSCLADVRPELERALAHIDTSLSRRNLALRGL